MHSFYSNADKGMITMSNPSSYKIQEMNYMEDITTVFILSVVLTVLRYSLQHYVKEFMDKNKYLSKDKSIKFSESAWKLLYYSFAWIWCASITLTKDFFWNPVLCLENFPNTPIDEITQMFYLFQLSFYISSTICHLTIETRRKDFMQMLAHHGVTSMLIGLSYIMRCHRFGLLVLVLHDISDVILESGKMLIYTGYSKTSDAMFLCLIGVWAFTRLFLYPIKVLYTTFILSIPYVGEGNYGFYAIINLLLFTIQILNIMWFGMMIRLLMNVILKKENIKDDREDSEETDSIQAN